MRQLYLNAILLTFAFFWLNPAFAQSGLKNTQEYKIEKFLLPDGLRGNSVTCIVQGPNDFLWFATMAAIDIQKELQVYNQERLTANRQPLKTGIGLNTGELMLGVIGDEHRYESTVISDAVNTASRMEGLTKVFGGAIIISVNTLVSLQHPNKSSIGIDFAYRYLGKVKVKGKDRALKIYDLFEGEADTIRKLKCNTKFSFEQGINFYFNQEFEKAAECLKEVLAVNKKDLAASYYLNKSVNYIIDGVAKDWDGVEEMIMK